MNFEQYRKEAYKYSVKHREHPAMLEFALGLSGEAAELLHEVVLDKNRLNIAKELGDVAWYVAALTTELGEGASPTEGYATSNSPYFTAVNPKDEVQAAIRLVITVGIVTESVKKHFYHGHELDKQMLYSKLGEVWEALHWTINLAKFSRDDVFMLNLDKLSKRYGNKFTVEASVGRKS